MPYIAWLPLYILTPSHPFTSMVVAAGRCFFLDHFQSLPPEPPTAPVAPPRRSAGHDPRDEPGGDLRALPELRGGRGEEGPEPRRER